MERIGTGRSALVQKRRQGLQGKDYLHEIYEDAWNW